MDIKLNAGAGVIVTADQIASAPPEVQRWFQNLVFSGGGPAADFAHEQDRFRSSEDGLAICDSLEIKALLRNLADDYVTLQVFFELGCELRDQRTGEKSRRVRRTADFLHRTDVGNELTLRLCVQRINAILCERRADPDVRLCRMGENDDFHVHETTQRAIHRFWLRLVGPTPPPDATPDTGEFSPAPRRKAAG